MVDLSQDTDVKVPFKGSGDAGRQRSAKQNVAGVAVLAAFKQVNKPLLQCQELLQDLLQWWAIVARA